MFPFLTTPGVDVRELLDAAPVILWTADPHTLQFTYVSRAAEEILGYPLSRWTSEPRFWPDHIHPDDLAVVDRCRRAIDEGLDHEFVYRMIAADGRTVWIRDRVRVKAGDPVLLSGAMVNITAEREAHFALMRSEENYRRLVHASPDAIGVHDGVRYLYVNPEFVRLFGAESAEQLIGREVGSLIVATQSAAPQRQRVARLDGKFADAEVTALPVIYNGIEAVQVVARDITDRIRTEERLQLLAAGTSEAIWEVDFATGSFWANDTYRDMIGDFSTLDEAYRFGLDNFHPEDRDRIVKRVNQRMDGSLTTWSDEYRIRSRKGDYVRVLDRGRVLHDDTGKPSRMIGALLDLTPLRDAEQRYRQIVEDVHDAIYTMDRAGRITSLNPAFEKFTGFRISDWIGRSMSDILTPESAARAFQNFNATLEQKSSGVRHYQMHNASGGLVDIEVSAKAQVVDGKVVGTIGVVRDVTERNRLQRSLEDARRISSLGQLAASVAHEFNNVLMSIQPFAEIVQRSSDSDALRTASTHITDAIARGKHVTSEILLYANPKEPQLEAVDVSSWLGSMLIALRAGLPQNIRIEAVPAQASILCDCFHLEQVITNLATNARDAMPDGGTITIEVAVDGDDWRDRAALDSSKRYARLTVRDTGTGMDARTLSQIWDPLFTTKRNGTGLGLPIAKRLVERQGGAIIVESEVGQGTAFHLLLPMAGKAAQQEKPSAAESSSSLQRVLIVEDEESVAVGLALLFESEGVECRHVATGEEVLPAMTDFKPQVLILDMNLPRMSGMEVLARIRIVAPSQPVILSSGHFAKLDLDEFTQAILKPYPFDELLCLCHRAVGKGECPSS